MADDALTPAFLASIQPIVLVGGRSIRFGRDKLREPWGADGAPLVQRPIEALRAVFGRRVKLVGACHPSILALADGVIPDLHPGIGPMGGVVSALEAWNAPVFVLAGDMPRIDPQLIRTVLTAAAQSPRSHAVIAADTRLHPCAGLYRPAALGWLDERLNRSEYSLTRAIPESDVLRVPCDAARLANVNLPGELGTP